MGLSIAVLTLVGTFAAAGAALAQSDALAVTAAWARATPGRAENGAAYLTIRSARADRLLSASTPAAQKTELHSTAMAGMVMQMRPLAGLDIPAAQTVKLKPGATHLMLIGLKEPLRTGASFPLTLDFAKAGARTVTVRVEGIGAMGPAAATQH